MFLLMSTWAFLLGCSPIWSWDFWWHLRTGELILERGHVPLVDWYTFTMHDRPWTDLHWGFQILIAVLFNIGGLNLMVLLKAALAAAILAVGWKASGNGIPVSIKAGLWTLALFCLDSRITLRPELLTLVFLGLALWIYRLLPQHPRLIWLLPVLQLVWTNCHGLFVLGLVLFAAYMGDQVFRGIFTVEEHPTSPHHATLGFVVALMGLSAFCNPYFEEGAFFPLELYRKFSVDKEFYSLRVGEFVPPLEFAKRFGIADLPLLSEMATWLLTVASFGLVWRFHRSVFRILAFSGFSYLAWVAWRNVGVFAVVATTVACWNLRDFLQLRRQADQSQSDRASTKTWSQRANIPVAVLLPLILIVLVLSGIWSHFAFAKKTFGLGETQIRFMHDACKFAGQSGFPDRAFLAWRHAGVYSYHNGPTRRVFMDGRLEVGTKRLYLQHDEILYRMAYGDPDWLTPLLDRSGKLPAVILDRAGSLPPIWGLLRDPEWKLVYLDKVGTVFLHARDAEALSLDEVDGTELMPDSR